MVFICSDRRSAGGQREGAAGTVSAGLARSEPPSKRRLSLAGPPARQQAFHADILVQVRPVDPSAAANTTPIGSLGRCPVRQTWKPSQRYSNCPAIGKIHDQRLVARSHALSNRFPEFNSRSTHAMPSPITPRFPQQEPQSSESPCVQSRGSTPGVLNRARTWPRTPPAPREHRAARLDPPSRRKTGMARIEELSATLPVYMVKGVARSPIFAAALRISPKRSASLLIWRSHPGRPIPGSRASPSRHLRCRPSGPTAFRAPA
jgi:hypothetical protein